MSEGPQRGLDLIDAIEGLDAYPQLHSARAELLRRLGRDEEAGPAYARAIELTLEPGRAALPRAAAGGGAGGHDAAPE